MNDLVIGLDLGTTNSCAAYYINGRLKILENSEGGRITPSFVYFTDRGGIIVGEHAKGMASMRPEYGIYEIKRLVGRKFDDPYIRNKMHHYPFKIEDDSNNPMVTIDFENTKLRKSPQQLCTVILKKMKKDIEKKLGHPVTKIVITVPANFNINQREVTLAAAQDAGFTVLKLFNEPTAAALSYYFENNCKDNNYYLVYDLGGGTFDVAILKKNNNNIEIVGVDGEMHLGGCDFDKLMVDYVCEKLMSGYNYDPKLTQTAERDMQRLYNKCEHAKKTLSSCEETTILLNGFVTDKVVEVKVTREQFESMAEDLFNRTIDIVDSCLKTCNVSKSDIKEVILSGGSTRIPKIQNLISEHFNGKTLNHFLNPDECVAEGAALQAAMLSKHPDQQINIIQMTDVTPLSLGINDFVDAMCFVIRRNSSIPTSASTTYATVTNQQKSMTFGIYEGERLDAKKNRWLGTVTILDITPKPPGQCAVTITLSIDQNGILTIEAKEKVGNKFRELTVDYSRIVDYARGDKSDNEVKTALKNSEENKRGDERFMKFTALKEYVLSYCTAVMYNLEKKKMTKSSKDIYELCELQKRIVEYATSVDDEEEVMSLFEVIKKQCEPIVKKYKFEMMPELRS